MNEPPPLPSPSGDFLINRQKQVSWFDTRQLLATGSQALAAKIVGSMSGRREIMAALEPGTCTSFDYHEREELWLDYVADTGDGWNATSSVAWLVGRDGLVLDSAGAPTPQPIPGDCMTEGMPAAAPGQLVLPAGRLLILGGDQVYPTASSAAYQHRFIDPFRCARWYERPARHAFSIPGNHDWYDGLTSFLRLFCQSGPDRRWFGAWQAQQRRSYYAMALPHRWWIWGLDMALEDDLDPPQIEYFRAQAQKLRSGDKLILVVPTPTWIKQDQVRAKGGNSRYFGSDKLDLIMKLPKEEGRDVDVPLVLTGDLHYYARHRAKIGEGTRDYLVCGGGGAFSLGTLQVPDEVRVRYPDGKRRKAKLAKLFPDRDESVKLRRRVLGFPFKNPAFTGVLTAIQAITIWLLGAGTPGWLDRLTDPRLGLSGLCRIVGEAAASAARSPGLLIWLLILLAGFGLYASRGGKPPKPRPAWWMWLAGLLHGLVQILGAFLCVWLAAQALGHLLVYGLGASWEAPGGSIGDDWATLLLAALIGYFYSGFVFGLYLLLAHKWLGLHDLEVFSAQAIEDYKCFLRMRVTARGLEIYPIGLRRHAPAWQAAPGASLRDVAKGVFGKIQAVIVPAGAQRVIDPCAPLAPELLEQPILIPGASEP